MERIGSECPIHHAADSIPIAPAILRCFAASFTRAGWSEPWRLMKRTFALLDARARSNAVSLEARALWRILDTYANPDGASSFPGIATLCRHGCCDRKRIYRLLKELESALWIIIHRRNGAHNTYQIIYTSPKSGTGRNGKTSAENGTGTSPKSGTRPHIIDPGCKRNMNAKELQDILFDTLNPPIPPRHR
jgi:helix-turn-helix protein